MTSPSADAQMAFVTNLQRLLGEGNFVATCKLAVLHVLADLSLKNGDAIDAALSLHADAIAEKVRGLRHHRGPHQQQPGPIIGPASPAEHHPGR